MNLVSSVGSGVQYMTDEVQSGMQAIQNSTQWARGPMNAGRDWAARAAGLVAGLPVDAYEAGAAIGEGTAHLIGHPLDSAHHIATAASDSYTGVVNSASWVGERLYGAYQSLVHD